MLSIIKKLYSIKFWIRYIDILKEHSSLNNLQQKQRKVLVWITKVCIPNPYRIPHKLYKRSEEFESIRR
jgi:hypothetical protein